MKIVKKIIEIIKREEYIRQEVLKQTNVRFEIMREEIKQYKIEMNNQMLQAMENKNG